jgi:hypothetical protein
MTRVIPSDADNLSNRTGDGGIHPSGPLLGDAIHTPNNVIPFLPRAPSRQTSAPSNLPLPAALYSRGERLLPLGKLAQASLDLVAVFVWLVLPLALWGALGLFAFALFCT